MLIKLHFSKSRNYLVSKSRKVLLTGFTLSMILLSITAKAQTTVTIPNLTTTSSFTGPFANNTRTYQMIIDDTQLTALNGKYLTSISFRLPSTAAAAWPAANTTYSDYQIYLSDGVDPVNRQLNFAANIVGAQTQVRSGSLLIPAGSVSNNGTFTFEITFNTPYLYTGTNLAIEVRHTGSSGNSTSVDAVGTSASGYGSLFTACWASTGNVMQGNFTYVKINSANSLGVKSVEIDGGASVYPNPAKDQLNVKSSNEIVELHIFNMAGQKVLSQKISEKNPQLNISMLTTGNYILQTIDKNGNSTSTRFIKE
ncbi:T9SS C-terminal target domain-containing protein [Chryseobacterium shandongense]|uniref:T9SS C-terminal target domain-containing protein n=1 Tax=Chryseobacterium shandongense TaxID=1493872 RepID=A0AAD0YFW9_9FLAO|nr:T9SS type A sorting domain-containing protein [Chryseobacterium shandongense]AZA87823.1 T9SS C-terminal target domain-containing protein [Chryseobacterium shandongense]AZA96383.1 T9SS C-terminal target domain-containing protein [Chryseobacterium shandongense]